MARSIWKGPFYEEYLLKKAEDAKKSGKINAVIKIWTRRSTILPEFVGLTFGVYNGKKFIPVSVNESMVGHKFGEFSPTRTFKSHSAAGKADDKKTMTTTPQPGSAVPTAGSPTATPTDNKPNEAPQPKKEEDKK